MAESEEVNSAHVELLKTLCRVCGNKLSKAKVKYGYSYNCQNFQQLFANSGLNLNIEKEDPAIHPPSFCHQCYCVMVNGKRPLEPVFWEIHNDENCSTCKRFEQSKKAGRPKKARRGGGGGSHNKKSVENTGQETQTLRTVLLNRAREIINSLTRTRHPQFDEKFQFTESKKSQFYCPVCTDLLEMPLETSCTHCACTECFIKNLEVNQEFVPSCFICQTKFSGGDDVKPAPRVFRELMDSQVVQCKKCREKIKYDQCLTHTCTTNTNPGPATEPQPIGADKASATPATGQKRTIEQALAEVRKGNITADVEELGTEVFRKKLRKSSDGTVLLKGRGKVRHKNYSVMPTRMVTLDFRTFKKSLYYYHSFFSQPL